MSTLQFSKQELDWKCIGFEPQDDRRLDRIEAEPDTRLIMLDAFVGDGECHTFRMVTDSGSSSLLKLNEDFNGAYEHISELRAVSEEEVELDASTTCSPARPSSIS